MSDCPSGFIQRRYCVYAIKVNYSSKTEFEFEGKRKTIQIKKRNKKSQQYTFVMKTPQNQIVLEKIM